jgi:hypothetical protein
MGNGTNIRHISPTSTEVVAELTSDKKQHDCSWPEEDIGDASIKT